MVGAVATELDKRMKQAITGDEYYRIGDLTLRAVNKITRKNEVRVFEIITVLRTYLAKIYLVHGSRYKFFVCVVFSIPLAMLRKISWI